MDMKRLEEIERVKYFFTRMPESGLNKDWDFLIQTIKKQQEQLEQRKETLEFYADPKTYEVNVTDQWDPRTPIDEDAGNQARKALEQS